MMIKHTTKAYQLILPKRIWQQAESLIAFVSTFPYHEPNKCKYCGSHNFAVYYGSRQLKCGIKTFYCYHCHKRFNQLTGSYFEGMHEIASWGELTRLRLAGQSTDAIGCALPISQYTVNQRVKTLEIIMGENYPELYRWFKTHNDYENHALSQQVKQEAKHFNQWIDNILNTTSTPCPTCHRMIKRMKPKSLQQQASPLFYCGRCRKLINLLADSPLKPLGYREQWCTFVKYLIQGESCPKIAPHIGLSPTATKVWRQKFIAQMELLRLEKLVYWLTWQFRRNYYHRAQQTTHRIKNN